MRSSGGSPYCGVVEGVSYIFVFFTIMELTLALTHTKYRSKCPLVTSLG